MKIFCYPQDDHESSFYSLSSGINYFSRIFLCLIFNRDFRLEIMILYLVVLLLCCHCSKFQQTDRHRGAHIHAHTHFYASICIFLYFSTFQNCLWGYLQSHSSTTEFILLFSLSNCNTFPQL